jgi:ATP-dependent RNA helicase SUPV3L1/SUV3
MRERVTTGGLSLAFAPAATDHTVMSGFAPRVRAVLGPTNTGKTHLAIERLMAHASGIIGFPLRLLARENYDRMVARKGARHVALITGEEKIVPPDARWYSCTVEAMPLDRQAEFVAVDEIQLCADPDRGHVFTERLLHARGLVETMFLGAETIRPLLQRLVPQAEVETRPRLSQLVHGGPAKLTRLPPRSAVVAFSAAEVYAIAELIRRRRGGCAVVMGRLSPRTRNAQVALYQDKEVDFLVATDAIGMGLNMDVDHVAFARLSKFDGHRPRALTAAEVAQIAGRAGRGMRDGTFGTTADCPPLDLEVVDAVEEHRFEPLAQLCWRNGELDFSSLDGLLDSLTMPPPGPGLIRGNDATDLETLAALAREPEMRELARGRQRVRLLWDACQVPDFRKLADESHVRLCARIFAHVVREGAIPTDWIAGQIAGLARADGDIDTLMQRLSGVRVWTYIAARADWVRDAAHWQARAREVEDLLSDALHERLTTRFVDRRAAHLMRRLEAGDTEELLSAVTRRGEVVVEGHPVGHVEGFGFIPDPLAVGDERRLVLRAARRALRDEMPRRVARLETAADSALAWLASQRIAWEGAPIARLRAGASALRPQVEVLDSEFLDGPARERVRRRLQRFVDAEIAETLAPLLAVAANDADQGLRGPLHRLVEEIGVVAEGMDIAPALRGRLKALGVRAGRHALFLPAVLKPRAAARRASLWALARGVAVPGLPGPGLVALREPADWPPGFAAAMGWVAAGPVLLRLDVVEKIAAELAWSSRFRPVPVPTDLASRLSVKSDLLPAVLHGLGFRLLPAAPLPEGQFGPPSPPMMAPQRRRRPAIPAPLPAREGPFAALAALRLGA